MRKEMNITGSLLLAGSFFLFAGCFGGVARGAEIGGVHVGGMTYGEAEEAVRAKIAETLPPVNVITPQGVVPAEGLSFRDDVSLLVRKAKRGEKLTPKVTRTWADMEGFLWDVCEKNAREAVDATVEFSSKGFTYTAGRDGVSCDYAALVSDAVRVLREGGGEITLQCRPYSPAVTEDDLRRRTEPLASFSTNYDETNVPRSENIALATSRISGTVLLPHEEFSFNRAVGARTEANGFKVAAVIQNGEFLPGVGGGVCQASTTLMGAALRSGMEVTESRPHSLAVSYVPPSLDAMVSSVSDLKFRNPYDAPVYILGKAEGGKVCFRFFGLPDGRRYETESVVLLRVAPPAPKIVEGEEERVLRAGKEGIASESYLLVYEGGTLISRTRLRRDSYAAVQGIVQKPLPEQEKNGDDEKKICEYP